MRLVEKDFGTPDVSSSGDLRSVKLTIDGVKIEAPENTSILRAATEAGIAIPKLCATDSLEAFGSCRLCLVSIEGQNRLFASCTESVQDDIAVITQSDKIAKIRHGIMELYISDHPLDCLTCSANGDCELQDMAGVIGLREVRYDNGANHLAAESDISSPDFS